MYGFDTFYISVAGDNFVAADFINASGDASGSKLSLP